MIQVDAQTMREIAPRFSGAKGERQNAIITAVGEVLATTLAEFKIDTRLRIAHFLAQTCHESAGYRTTEEFADGSAYENRHDLGNDTPGDGPRYKGRGLIQLTGRSNYKTSGERMKLKPVLVDYPETAAEPVLSLRIACDFWITHKINQFADSDNVVQVTRIINGGTNGLAERRTLTSAAKTAVIRLEGFVLTGDKPPLAPDRPVLRRGSAGDAVGTLQTLLRQLGFMVAVDNDFGAGTEVAVAAFQKQSALSPVDGIVGNATWQKIDEATSKRKPAA